MLRAGCAVSRSKPPPANPPLGYPSTSCARQVASTAQTDCRRSPSAVECKAWAARAEANAFRASPDRSARRAAPRRACACATRSISAVRSAPQREHSAAPRKRPCRQDSRVPIPRSRAPALHKEQQLPQFLCRSLEGDGIVGVDGGFDLRVQVDRFFPVVFVQLPERLPDRSIICCPSWTTTLQSSFSVELSKGAGRASTKPSSKISSEPSPTSSSASSSSSTPCPVK